MACYPLNINAAASLIIIFNNKFWNYAYFCIWNFEETDVSCLINFVNNFNNIGTMYHEKSTLQVSIKLNITCNSHCINSSVIIARQFPLSLLGKTVPLVFRMQLQIYS